ncbi:Hypothetical protein FKW44_008064 [Caligus rogercresseyi]|uniref:Uncharacterized protein n=1 Tax=Caligus rogercresseyi TaxID=217165 RepID=A0A7T8KFL3_CALRO|nr:Hypothetical protein FKW44_008064 [Caligus rogercresseyi]
MKELPNVSPPPPIIEEEDETRRGKYNDWNHATRPLPFEKFDPKHDESCKQ